MNEGLLWCFISNCFVARNFTISCLAQDFFDNGGVTAVSENIKITRNLLWHECARRDSPYNYPRDSFHNFTQIGPIVVCSPSQQKLDAAPRSWLDAPFYAINHKTSLLPQCQIPVRRD